MGAMPTNLRMRDSGVRRLVPRLAPVEIHDKVLLMMRSGQHLCWSGDPVSELWSVEHGSLKSYEVSRAGRERVSGFYFRGDVLGCEALACGAFRANVVALERSVVVALPVGELLAAASGDGRRRTRLLDGIGAEFQRLQTRLSLEQCAADARLASFLLWMGRCRGERLQGAAIRLPMSRGDIASYLGLAAETVSRRLAGFQGQGWIRLQRRTLWLDDPEGLRQLCEADC